MSYTIEFAEAPETVVAGEPFVVSVNVCCTNPDGCERREFYVTLDGYDILNFSLQLDSDFCFEIPVGQTDAGIDTSEVFDVDFDNETLTINDTGTYTLTTPGGSKQITVQEEPFDPSKVSVSCSLSQPNNPSPGDTVTVGAVVTNSNIQPADVELFFALGGSESVETTTVSGTDTKTVTNTFLLQSTGSFTPTVEYEIQ